MKGDAKSEGLSVKKDLLSKNSKLTPKSQNIMSSGNSLLAAPNNNYESDSDVLKIDEDIDNSARNGDKRKDDDIADPEMKENGIDSEEEAMSNKELAERAVPAVGFFNPWTGEEIPDEDEMIDGVGPAFPSMDNSLSSLSRLDISGDKSGGLITSTPGQDGKDPMTNKYSCARCGRSYLHQATLVRHQRYECGISASYPCGLCGRKFKRRDVLKGHMEKCMNKSTVASPIINSSTPSTMSPGHMTMSIPSIPTISAISSLACMPSLPYGGP